MMNYPWVGSRVDPLICEDHTQPLFTRWLAYSEPSFFRAYLDATTSRQADGREHVKESHR